MDQGQASDVIQEYLKVHLDQNEGLKSETLLPFSKKMIAEALRTSLSRADRSSFDDDLLRGVYLRLSEYQPHGENVGRRLADKERASLAHDLRELPEKPLSEEIRRELIELFPPATESAL